MGVNETDIAAFRNFANKYGKRYESDEEYKYRLGVFRDNMKKVKLLQDNEQGSAEYGATMFADLTGKIFLSQLIGNF